MSHHDMRGVVAVSTTPFDADGAQDLAAHAQSIERVLAAGADGVLALGATAEALALSESERIAQLETTVKTVGSRAYVVAGCMAYTPEESLRLISQAQDIGVDAVMITPPFYGGLEPAVAAGHMRTVVEKSPLPVMVYNNPGATGIDLLPADMQAFSGLPMFWSIKETSGGATRVRELRAELGEDVHVFIGADGLALEGFTQGASGWVAASAWLLPRECVKLWTAVDSGDWAEAVKIWRPLSLALGQIEDSSAFISLIKKGLGELGFDQGPVRPPLEEAGDDALATLMSTIADLEN